MKTLAVLSALASIVIAAPALPGEGVTDFKLPEDNFPEVVKREKKSPLPDVEFIANQTPVTLVDSPFQQNTDLVATGRSLGLKKPIIIKKKAGYHLYRNSDEEQALSDPQESCRKQVKVKLCDEENSRKSNMMRISSIEDTNIHMTGHDMKHSIQLAKEAVENLQRDLKKIEQKPSLQLAPGKEGDTESDPEIHQDIEVARQALEHVHKNFGNLESMSLHATAAKDADNVHDVQFTIAKTEDERMAQWKEAIENIHKNVEIARNIEDTFKSVTDQPSLVKNDETDKHTSVHETKEKIQMRTSGNTNSKEAGTCDEDQMLKKSAHEISSQKSSDQEEMVEEDMKTSASTISEAKILDPSNEKVLLEKAALQNSLEKENAADSHNQHDKSADEITLSRKTIEDENETKPKTEKSISENKPKSAGLVSLLENHNQNSIMKLNVNNSDKKMKHENIAKESNKKEDQNQLKSVGAVEISHDNTEDNKKVDTELNTEESKAAVDAKMFVTSVEQMAKESEEDVSLTQKQEKSVHSMKSSEQIEKSSTGGKAMENNIVSAKSTDPTQRHTTKSIDLKPLPSTNMEMKLADNDWHSKQLNGQSDMHWAQDKNMHFDQSARMKAAEGLENDFHDTDHLRNTHSTDQPHQNTAMKNTHNFDTPSGQGFHPHPSSFHDNPMTHGKSAHMDSLTRSNFHMNMRDAVSEFGPENHMFRWKGQHETGRTAYGSGPSSGVNLGGGTSGGAGTSAGAVGVFPNANIGSCGIPLLLSCAPSVVSGSLAKAHSTAYGTPAYRTEEDFNFHTKRDVKKNNEIPVTKVQRKPANTKLKTTTILDTNH